MERDAILRILRRTGALTDAHLVDGDGYHRGAALRPQRATQYAPYNRQLAYEIVRHFLDLDIHVVLALDTASLPFAVEIGRQLDARTIWTSDDGSELHPDFSLHHGERVLVVAAHLESNEQTRSAVAMVRAATARLIGVGSLVDSRGAARLESARDTAAIKLDLPRWSPEHCPRCADGVAFGILGEAVPDVERRIEGWD